MGVSKMNDSLCMQIDNKSNFKCVTNGTKMSWGNSVIGNDVANLSHSNVRIANSQLIM
jgi:hypothetical protein